MLFLRVQSGFVCIPYCQAFVLAENENFDYAKDQNFHFTLPFSGENEQRAKIYY